MKKNFIFHTPKNFYLYDRNTNYIVCISEDLYQYLDGSGDITDSIQHEIDKLQEMDIFHDTTVKKIENPESEFLKYKLDRKLNKITLQVTQQCNLRCQYCVYSEKYENRVHSNRNMSQETAKRSIDFLAEHSLDSPKLYIGFYGGEPLLRFSFIKEQMEYAKKRLEGKELTFILTTNGTLLNDEMIEYFMVNHMELTVSLDGDQKSHNKNRRFYSNDKGSFDTIFEKLQHIKEKYPDYFKQIRINAVIDPDNDFRSICSFFRESPLLKDLTVSAGVISSNYSKEEVILGESYKKDYGYETFKFILSEFGVIDKEKVSNLFEDYLTGVKKVNARGVSYLGEITHPGGPCTPGIQRLFVSVDGMLYPCEKVDEESKTMRLGDIYEGFDLENVMNILNIGSLTEKECKNCWAFRLCTACAAGADDKSEFSKKKRLEACNSIRENVEFMLKSYCMFQEFGYDFGE